MQRTIVFLCLSAGVSAGCKIHRLPELPPERDPSAEEAPVVPYRAPPDVLTTELSTGAPAGGDMAGHEGHGMGGGAPAEPPPSTAPSTEPGHAGHGGDPAPTDATEQTAKPAGESPPETDHSGHDHGGGR